MQQIHGTGYDGNSPLPMRDTSQSKFSSESLAYYHQKHSHYPPSSVSSESD